MEARPAKMAVAAVSETGRVVSEAEPHTATAPPGAASKKPLPTQRLSGCGSAKSLTMQAPAKNSGVRRALVSEGM